MTFTLLSPFSVPLHIGREQSRNPGNKKDERKLEQNELHGLLDCFLCGENFSVRFRKVIPTNTGYGSSFDDSPTEIDHPGLELLFEEG
jgi:hypothetical protein